MDNVQNWVSFKSDLLFLPFSQIKEYELRKLEFVSNYFPMILPPWPVLLTPALQVVSNINCV
jgi:hypothetical protein